MANVTQRDREAAVDIQAKARRCCDELPCHTLTTLIAETRAEAREEGRQAGFREGVERSAQYCDRKAHRIEKNLQIEHSEWRNTADDIRALLPPATHEETAQSYGVPESVVI